MPEKTCFIIAPIDDPRSEVRRRSDQVRKHIIDPVATALGYRIQRADDISKPGFITSQVIERLASDDLVIADLTDSNPNVFYELAVRHAARKPVIQMIQAGQRIPFDVAPHRTIIFDSRDWDSVGLCRETLEKQIKSIEEDPTHVETPLSIAGSLEVLQQSPNPLAKASADILNLLAALVRDVQELKATRSVYSSVLPVTAGTMTYYMNTVPATTYWSTGVTSTDASYFTYSPNIVVDVSEPGKAEKPEKEPEKKEPEKKKP
jgi:hypothetical protein